ncbi:MAG: 30S ribosomal protein S16, partial [Gammaproteobacteria bacterium]|nr:30S ribosomal protein S16 [Gammaproteobacteria bacterium]
MVRIRLSRGGAKKRPYYHIVVMDKRQRRDGRCLERIGSYDPNLETEDRINLDLERLDYWVSKGAQISDRVKYLKEYSQDKDNLKNREKIKLSQLEKLKKKRLAKKEEVKAEEPAKEEVKTEEAAAPEAPAEEPAKEEVKTEEAAAP